ncbi:MAG: tRNA 4-thiouridine(8) synthase ThiI [Ruminococcaceae bacterium]|nr:tRNA 4-thiouridine(8) synthase ThiI [Oscillospiraceae bacterium]
MKEVILIKDGELALKGLNRRNFESIMTGNIRRRLRDLGGVQIRRAQSTLYIEPLHDDFDFEEALERVSRIFGIAGFSRACVCEKNMADILGKAPEYLRETLKNAKTFKVEAKRADKRFELKSPEICREVGGVLLGAYPHLKVDVHNPDIVVMVEIRDYAAYLHAGQIHGAGGLPVGTAGHAAILISGGIDSPVAAWTMAKRGLTLDAIHFASPPYTSPRAELKVKTLLSKVARYSGIIRLWMVPFTEIQEKIGENCPEDYFTLIMRRMMMRIAERVASKNNCLALITGESLGQVASQTLPAIAATDSVTSIPVLRPLIGMDKEEIVRISKAIDTFETSILPYEDCCTVFTPKHPHTKPKPGQCEAAEEKLDIEALVEKAVDETYYVLIDASGELPPKENS